MRTTIRIDDELLETLRKTASKEKVSLNRVIEKVLRAGIRVLKTPGKPRPRFKQKVHSMGEPLVNLDKALAISALFEDEETIRKLNVRK